MMRLLLTLLAALGFVWAYSSARADEAIPRQAPAVVSDAAQPGPRQFGAKSGDARIVIEAREEAWVRVSHAQGALVFMRTMKPGESYRVPDRAGLVLDTGNAKGLLLRVDGKEVPDAVGMVRRGIALNPELLRDGAVAAAEPEKAPAPVARDEKPAEAVLPPSAPVAADVPTESPTSAETAVMAEAQASEPVSHAKEIEPAVPPREALSAPPAVVEAKPGIEPTATTPPEAPAEPAADRATLSAEAATGAPVQKSGPRHFAANRHDARIVIEAKEAVWLRIKDAAGKIVFMRNMQAGDTYRVPNQPGLVLDSGNAKGLSIEVDGKPVPRISGMVRRGIAFDPEALQSGAVARAAPAEPQPQLAAAAPSPAAPTDLSAPPPAAPVAPEPAQTAGASRSDAVAPAEPGLAASKTPELAETAKAEEKRAAPAGMLTATLPGPLPTAPAQVEPIAPAVAPVLAPVQSASRKAAPAAHVAPAAPQHAAPPVVTESVKPVALAAPKRANAERAESAVTAAAATAPAGVISSSSSRIGLEINKGTLVRLSQPAATVFVADPEIADIQMKSPGLVYIFGRKAGETALYAVDDRERVVLGTTLVVSHNVSRLRQTLRAVAPDANIDVISVDNSLILTGTVHSPVEAENIRAVAARFVPDAKALINQLRVVAPNQINLRVRVAEVSKETLKQFGINWESIARLGGNVLFGVGVGRDFITGNTFMREGTTNTLFGGYRNSSQDINAAIDALATEGLITVLAEPNLTALSGETASFLAGGEFPVPIAQSRESNSPASITVEFKTFGVGLAFTPHLLDAGRINLRVRPEVSQLSTAGAVTLSGFTIPALTTRRAETTVELGSGQSFVIAGLLQNNSTQDISKVPLLGDLPVLGALFKSDRFRRNESELVIIVTPYIVRPVSANKIASPTDGFVAPSDVERILGAQTYKQQIPDSGETPRTKDGHGLVGPTGFQLD